MPVLPGISGKSQTMPRKNAGGSQRAYSAPTFIWANHTTRVQAVHSPPFPAKSAVYVSVSAAAITHCVNTRGMHFHKVLRLRTLFSGTNRPLANRRI